MPIMLQSNHALFFDGVSDGVIIPQGMFSRLGRDNSAGERSASDIIGESSQGAREASLISDAIPGEIAIEAWVTPDCGGIVLSKSEQFQLRIGSIDTPGPAVFEVNVVNSVGIRKIVLSTASDASTGYDGTVYPSTTFGGFEDSYNRFDSGKDDATNLNINHRPLIHLVGAVSNGKVSLYVNGELMATENIDGDYTLPESDDHVYIGGRGGEFRGVIESIHVSARFNPEMTSRSAALVGDETLCLFRFEEPVDPIAGTYTISSIADSSGLSNITISTSDAASLASTLTGKTVTTGTVDFTTTPYSSGDYSIVDHKTLPGTKRTHLVPHVPYNLLINPGAINRDTQKPNQSPPERVRLHSINVTSGVLLVSSIHLDFVNSTHDSRDNASLHDGLRGVLHSRSAGTGDNYFVVVAADLLLDNGSGKPYQPPHLASQLIDRTGQMVLDESDLEQHGIVFSSRMATTANDSDNPFAVTWPTTLDESFQIGHSGRHTFNHVNGHQYLRNMPRANEETLDQQVGNADIITLMFDESAKGIDRQFPINSQVDYYRDISQHNIVTATTESKAYEAVDNGLTGASRRLIAIGGAGTNVEFDPMPFVLKGPAPQKVSDVDDNMRKHHLRPSATSRVAVLEVDLSSYNMASYVEIHYNAIDFTGASMNKTAPMLMVEKTVPASNLLLTGSTYVIDAIEASLSSGKTLHAPGGIIELTSPTQGSLGKANFTHALVGDNSEGYESDDELDERYTPQNYTTMTSEPRRPPENISASHTSKTGHDSVFHRVIIEATSAGALGTGNRRNPALEVSSPSNGQFDTGIAASKGPVHEMFDIIDNHAILTAGSTHRLFIQPSDRARSAQLRHLNTRFSNGGDSHFASVMYLMTRARLRSVAEEESEDGGRFTVVRCVGANSAAITRNVDEIGSGSPNSHVVKEIEPNAPVVTVSLGGVGQGAYDTNPSFDPSTLTRLPYNTRRGYSALATTVRVDLNTTSGNRIQYIEVRALNNNSDDLKSWGTYPFPQKGRIFLKTGASAAYNTKTGAAFIFTDSSIGSGDFVLPDGSEVANFYQWVDASGLASEAGNVGSGASLTVSLGEVILGDSQFYMENSASDGSTVNDRMFQSMDTVTHDYQLGSQFASTRALVEIPLFNEQFFENAAEGIFPGPDNSLKLHLDPTMTAHTWNPSPVGRRYPETSPADRSANAAYAYALSQNEHTRSASIQHKAEVVSGKYRLYVSDPDIFPAADTSSASRYYVSSVVRYQRAFLPNGEWVIYENDPASQGYIEFEDETWAFSENFLRDHETGMLLLVGGGYQAESLVPLVGSTLTPSSAIERRSEYYHDAASAKTQGGNVDYGLRQYVSAVEFKAGPTTNPHAPRVQTGRAAATILGVRPFMSGSTFSGIVMITFDEEDTELFPHVDVNIQGGKMVYETGDYHYNFQTTSPDGTIRKFIYHGDASAVFTALTGTPTSPIETRGAILVEDIFNSGGALPNYLDATDSNFILNQEGILTHRGFNLGIDDVDNRGLEKTLNISDTYRPQTTAQNPWFITATSSATEVTCIPFATGALLQANTLGLDVQVGDRVYAEAFTNATSTVERVMYIGVVGAIADGMAQSTPTQNTVITMSSGMTTAVRAQLQSDISDSGISVYLRVGCHDVMLNDEEAILNRTWLFPYAPGGLRNGDTIWANMTYNNPHATEGMFAKSRGVYNEALVWNAFNGGTGSLDGKTTARTAIPVENFLIGNTCRETAINYAQHVNKTIEINYDAFGDATEGNFGKPPIVAFVDPYLADDDHARVLLYDVAHDREFIAFQDLHMQVQSSAKEAEIGFQRHTTTRNLADGSDQIELGKYGITYNGAGQHPYITQIDVPAGFPSQNKYVRSTVRSRFMESAYAHDVANRFAASTLRNPTKGTVTTLVDAYAAGSLATGSGYATATGVATTSVAGGTGLTIDITGVDSGGGITTFTINNGGSNYKHAELITVSGGDGNAKFKARISPDTVQNHLTSIDRITQFGKSHGHFVQTGYYTGGPFSERAIADSILPRTNDAVAIPYWADEAHTYARKIRSELDRFVVAMTLHRLEKTGATVREPSTLFDTPDGTRVIPAFLALRGIRSETLNLTNHVEASSNTGRRGIDLLPHWTDMDFTRRLTIDCGEVATRDGVTDIEAAAREVVRIINQAGAKNARVSSDGDETGSAHNPAVWWDNEKAFTSLDKGSHMGYFRAHLGRVVQDTKGREGFSIIIHSTVPGATGRNFCVWLDNARGQSQYQPEFLIGHGGRFRTFWCLPDEVSGENMHPAPMPLNKHGRPFAPITSLQQYTLPDETSEQVKPTSDFAQRGDEDSDPVMRAMSMVSGSGQSHNTVNTESLEAEGFITSFTEGLRVGTQAVGRLNLGGLVAAGVPGFAPDAGTWGFGRKGDKRFNQRYGNIHDTEGTTVLPTIYSSYVPSSQISHDAIGNSSLYGFEFIDHLGNRHGIRMVYRTFGEAFSLDETQLPDTLEDEIIISIDDRDVGQGGFTIGRHMHGIGDATGRFGANPDHAKLASWRGNKWNGVPGVNAAYDTKATYDAVAKTITLVLEAPYHASGTCSHFDVLGYMGFPVSNGLIQVSDPFNDSTAKGSFGHTFSYTHRTRNDKSGTHVFFGVEGSEFMSSQRYNSSTHVNTTRIGFGGGGSIRALVSSCINWTTLLTDEVIAAVLTAAINLRNPNDEEGIPFDCRDFFAGDGRTLGEWGVAEDAIRIRAYNPANEIRPVSDFFTATLHRDMAIQAAHIEHGDIEFVKNNNTGITLPTNNRSATDAQIDAGLRAEVGYLPYTVVQVTTKGRGSHANTSSPVLVDSFNNPVNTQTWGQNLNGERFTAYSGDHILPMVNNPVIKTLQAHSITDPIRLHTDNELWHFVRPAGEEGATLVDSVSSALIPKVASFGNESLVSLNNGSALVTSQNGGNSKTYLDVVDNTKDKDFPTTQPGSDAVMQRFHDERCFKTAGVRVLGSVHSHPQVFFRGGRDSTDHWVPLFFGGGFSGVTIDVNDGTDNDYSDKYTHPYANGPTGVAGIQHANETLSSFSLVDCNAIMAFFPGTALLNQHRGSINPPFFNQDNILSVDVKDATQSVHPDFPNPAVYSRGVAIQVPVPLVLRFAHPTARYQDHRDGTENKTTFLIYGPGQAFPFTQEIATPVNTFEPHPGRALTVGNTWSKLPSHTGSNTAFMPNHIHNDEGDFAPWTSAYQLARGRFHWRQTINWEPAQGKPNVAVLFQRPESGRMYGEVFTSMASNVSTANVHDYRMAHPNRHAVFMGHAMAANSDLCFHMDGGYHPGGSWLDNQITFNPPHPDDNSRVTKETEGGGVAELHPCAFRVAAPLATKVLYGSSGAFQAQTLTASDVNMEYIAVDATKCQNGEELAALLGAAINTYPGGGALKAMGGTFLPSMGTSNRQDRYGWVEISNSGIVEYSHGSNAPNSGTLLNASFITVNMGTNSELAYRLPESGWLRTSSDFATGVSSENTPAHACYHSRIVMQSGSDFHVKFFLAINRISGFAAFEDIKTWDNALDGVSKTFPNVSSANKLYVWTKGGVHRFVNFTRDVNAGYGAVHFNGLVDAIDRTKPVGVVGWHGERYSALNTLMITASGQSGFARGLGAWHSALGFSPYGGSMGCATILGHLPNISPMPNSPESSEPSSGQSLAQFPTNSNQDGPALLLSDGPGAFVSGFVDSSDFNTPPLITYEDEMQKELTHVQGVYARALLVVSHESELALIAKTDRNGQKSVGDWLRLADAADVTKGGTVRWDDRIHGQDRFYAPANAGPNVEALIHSAADYPTISDYTTADALDGAPFNAAFKLHAALSNDTELSNAEPCAAKTGDLFLDLDKSLGSVLSSTAGAQRNVAADFYASGSVRPSSFLSAVSNNQQKNSFWVGDVNAYDMYNRSPAKNFNVEHVVWKRMDGGSLSLPAVNARGLGAIPWTTRVSGGNAYVTGEVLHGNVRFSFETTNSAMMPVLQAQEVAHPQLAEKHRVRVANVLEIPNEHLQFEDMEVVDDTGQTHTISGGSPLGIIIKAFRASGERLASGLAPATANSGVEPNLRIQLPDPESIPGNIVVRSGFDRLQAYQNETMGDGGMIHPDLGASTIGHLFDNEVKGPRFGPTMNEVGWEHFAQGVDRPDSTRDGWVNATENRTLQSSYEQHDRTLYFHVTKMGHSSTSRYTNVYTHANGLESQALTVSSYASNVLTASASITATIYDGGFATKEVQDEGSGKRRRFLRLSTAKDSVVVSYTGITGSTFTGVVGDIDFEQFLLDNPPASTTININPSYYVPAGSTRFFAARRLRDHAEVSGNSPDMAHTEYATGSASTLVVDRYKRPQLTPMPLPRMGHHFVNATMPMLPGHWAHPAYQGLYSKHESERKAVLQNPDTIDFLSRITPTTTFVPDETLARMHNLSPELRISSMTAAPSGPSDIHGGAFTLMFETKVRFDGYGILASDGTAGAMNKLGGHSIVLEAGANYTQDGHFPDPAEVGAYQIVIQPNLRKQQIGGFHHNNGTATGLPDGSARELTGQQVNLVVGIKYDSERGGSPVGGATLILAEATLADVRGCEIFVNELILDHDPDHGSQFTNVPPMLLYNPLGVQGNEAPSFTRRSQPYHPGMFIDATPGYTTSIPWWSILHKVAPDDSTSTGFRHLALYRIDNYYEFCRASYGSIGAQLTMAGYPSISPDIYSKVMANVSVTPTAVVQSGGSNYIQVDDASYFPEVPYYGQVLVYEDANGDTKTVAYTQRTGTTHASATMNQPYRFIISGSNPVPVGTTVRLSAPYTQETTRGLLTTPKHSVFSIGLDELVKGSRDTNSLYTPDAFVCAWHPNLGRPHTFYSDDSSRTWGNPTSDRAVNRAAYNSTPEHFEMVHYHAVNYAASFGPFNLDFKTPKPPTQVPGTFSSVNTSLTNNVITMSTSHGNIIPNNSFIFSQGKVVGKVHASSGSDITLLGDILYIPTGGSTVFFGADGTAETPANIHAMTGYEAQGSNTVMLSHYWPCGSRGGPLVSNLEGFAAWSAAWHIPRAMSAAGGKHWEDADDDGSYAVSSGLAIASSLVSTRTYPFGYRFGLRQPWNRPQWGHYGMRAFQEEATHSGASNFTVGYKAGPLVEYETETWNYAGGTSSLISASPQPTLPTTYVGIMERQTNFSGMLGPDKAEWQVRYSDGRRMTRSFGCPVRIIRNASTAPRDWWGDSQGLGISTIDGAVGYYLVDWWGNTRGEDVRKAPVRGFGIRPAWDAGDAYEYDRTNGRTPYARLWNNDKPIVNLKGIADSSGDVVSSPTSVPRFGGRVNSINNGSTTTLVDVFAPTNAMRVGDMGGGRGVRYPTHFNEDLLVELNAVYEGSGVVLSHNTAEPTFGQGYLRPRDDVLQPDEVSRGISRRLEVDEDGLLKPEATVSDRVESISGTSVHKEPISRSSPRIGIDADTIESRSSGISADMVAINSEAHSLHTDTGVGQRVVLQGGMQSGSHTLGDYDLTGLSFAAQPHGGVMRFSHTSNIKAMGGTYILESRSFVNPFDDTGWGRSGAGTTSNPYQTSTSTSNPHNLKDTTVRFMLRPVRLLDNQHVAVFRSQRQVASSTPQDSGNYYGATSGGKYGLFTYEATNGGATSYMRTTLPNANAPYQPVYLMENSSDTVPASYGPKLPGAGVTGFDTDTLKTTVTRLLISENSLQHYRSDAPRRTGSGKDFAVKARFSQSLHGKGHKADVTYSTSDHSGDAA